ncbi:MAG: hypothetical protein LBC41_15515 [Clostridiales bacterium]|jgi:hypothetical protein|nr:hypothetical protein [Clostridiales bacterium]MDR2752062.1 hypothetical protein [Clostridiales bacterium]
MKSGYTLARDVSGELLRKDAVTTMVNSLLAGMNKTPSILLDKLASEGVFSQESAESFKSFGAAQGLTAK